MIAYAYDYYKDIWLEMDIIMPTLILSNLGFKDCWYFQIKEEGYDRPQNVHCYMEHIIFSKREFIIKDIIE